MGIGGIDVEQGCTLPAECASDSEGVGVSMRTDSISFLPQAGFYRASPALKLIDVSLAQPVANLLSVSTDQRRRKTVRVIPKSKSGRYDDTLRREEQRVGWH